MRNTLSCKLLFTWLALAAASVSSHVAFADEHPNEVPPSEVPPTKVPPTEPPLHGVGIGLLAGGTTLLALGTGEVGAGTFGLVNTLRSCGLLPGEACAFTSTKYEVSVTSVVLGVASLAGGVAMVVVGARKNAAENIASKPPIASTLAIGAGPGGFALRGTF